MNLSSSGAGRRRGRAGSPPLSEINIIPLVDVVLVLLIIFMLTASVMEFGLEIDVPKTKVSATSAKDLPVLSINKDGDIYLNEKQVNINMMVAEVQRRFPGQQSVYLRASKESTWDDMVQVMAMLSQAKLNVNVVTKTEDSAPTRAGQ